MTLPVFVDDQGLVRRGLCLMPKASRFTFHGGGLSAGAIAAGGFGVCVAVPLELS